MDHRIDESKEQQGMQEGSTGLSEGSFESDQDLFQKISWRESLGAWCRISAMSFGGPAGQIAVMHRVFVEEKRWISESRFLHALQFCMLLPGPEAQQLMTYCGWLMHRTRGALIAGTLFILPGFLSILALSYLYLFEQEARWLQGMFAMLQPAVVVLVIQAMLKLGGRTLRDRSGWVIALGAFLAVFFFDISYPWLVPVSAAAGWWAMRGAKPDVTGASAKAGDRRDRKQTQRTRAALGGKPKPLGNRRSNWRLGRAVRVLVIGGLLWLAPIAGFQAMSEPRGAYVEVGTFFARASVVTFGGAYSVLGYVARRAVDDRQWLTSDEMMDGLAMAETTPGPLIQVVQFVGFLATARDPGGWSPVWGGLIGACLTTWVTFVPSFIWVLFGAEQVESWYGNRRAQALLHGVSSAVVGVLGDLAIRFALSANFGEVSRASWGMIGAWLPDPSQWNPLATGVMILAGVAIIGFRMRSATVLIVLAGVGALGGWLWGRFF